MLQVAQNGGFEEAEGIDQLVRRAVWDLSLIHIFGLVSLTEGFTMRFGDIFTFIGGFFYAAHMIAVARFGREKDPFLLTIVQFGSAAVCSWICLLYTSRCV